MIIESLSNNLIKHACALKQKKYRDEYGEFLAEGMRLVSDIALTAQNSVVKVFATESALDAASKATDFSKIELSVVSDTVMKKLSDTENSQGIVAVVKKRERSKFPFVEGRPIGRGGLAKEITHGAATRLLCHPEPAKDPPHGSVNSGSVRGAIHCIENDKYLFLDRIRDPGNLGTILRTAAAAGYSLILNDCADPYSPKVIRSCMGGIMSVDFIESNQAALFALKSQNYRIIAADLNGQDLFDSPKYNKICIVIGSETDGISEEIKVLCDETVTIPMQNMESLNAAVSAGIIMYYYR